MTPAAFWILAGLIACCLGGVIVYWARSNQDGTPPEDKP